MTEKQQSVTTESVTSNHRGCDLRLGAKPADQRHPFGYGRAALVWALIAALFTLVSGSGLLAVAFWAGRALGAGSGRADHHGRALGAAKVDFVDTVSAADVEAACGLGASS